MNVPFDSDEVLREDIHLGGLDVSFDTFSLTSTQYLIDVFILVDACHITTIEYVVEILKHLLVDDLRITKQKREGFIFHTSDHESSLHILPP